jgi:hypothetical protein
MHLDTSSPAPARTVSQEVALDKNDLTFIRRPKRTHCRSPSRKLAEGASRRARNRPNHLVEIANEPPDGAQAQQRPRFLGESFVMLDPQTHEVRAVEHDETALVATGIHLGILGEAA